MRPHTYRGRKVLKEGKIKEKVTRDFSYTLFCVVQVTKWRRKGLLLVRVYARAFQQRC